MRWVLGQGIGLAVVAGGQLAFAQLGMWPCMVVGSGPSRTFAGIVMSGHSGRRQLLLARLLVELI